MKGWPAYVVVAAVVVAVLVNVSVLVRGSGSSDFRDRSEISAEISELRREIAELRYYVQVMSETLNARGTSTGDDSSRGFPPDDEILLGGGPVVDEPPPAEVNTEPVDIVLTIDAAGACTLDGKVVEREKLGAELKRVLQANPAMLLVIEADKGVPLGHVTSVQAAAREAGIHRISLAVEVVEVAPDEATPDTD